VNHLFLFVKLSRWCRARLWND